VVLLLYIDINIHMIDDWKYFCRLGVRIYVIYMYNWVVLSLECRGTRNIILARQRSARPKFRYRSLEAHGTVHA
jgi:hypothetical protein